MWGTPTAVAAVPIANRSKTPFFGAYTGAGVLRKTPPDRYVINYRASYEEETAAMVKALMEEGKLKPEEVAFFTQRDTYGDAGFTGGLAALKRYGLQEIAEVAHGRYERNTLAVENGLADILFHEPAAKAVIMVGAYGPCAEFIRLAKEHGLDARFLNVSFVGAAPLLNALGEEGGRYDRDAGRSPLRLRAADNRGIPSGARGLRRIAAADLRVIGGVHCGARVLPRPQDGRGSAHAGSRDRWRWKGLGEFDMGLGEPLRLGRDDHQASHRVWPTVLRGDKVVPFDWSELAAAPAGE